MSALIAFAKTIPEIADPVFWICRSATHADDDCSVLIDDDCGVLICLRAALRTINIKSIWETHLQIRLLKKCVVLLCFDSATDTSVQALAAPSCKGVVMVLDPRAVTLTRGWCLVRERFAVSLIGVLICW